MTESVMKTKEMNGDLSPKFHKTDTKALFGQNNNIVDRKLAGLKIDSERNYIDKQRLLNMDDIKTDASVLQRFYSGSNVFVTGATGFMGKVLIEKLLRSCPDIENIYMMVREKKGRSMEERIDDVIGSPCFDRIKKENPKFREKLHAIGGDIGLEGLGISEYDKQILDQKIDIVFHVAATVRFDEKLKTAILNNVRGTREVLNLCRSFRKLKSVIHVSTIYSNSPSRNIDESLFESPLDSAKAIKLAETLDLELLEQLAPTMIGEWPNSYAFTKAVSEDVVKTYGQGLPAGIFRPAIVVSTRDEPMPGWIDNMYGPTGVIAGVAAGVLRTINADENNEANIVPCDMVINAMIASAWDVACTRENQQVPVYNYVSPHANPLTWLDFTTKYMKYGMKAPPSVAIWYLTMTMVTNRTAFLVLRFFLHQLPAMFIDLFFLATNRKRQMVTVYNKIHRFVDVIAYFATRHWKFQDDNVVGLWDKLDSQDQELFFFNMRSLDWETYIRDTCPGIRKFILKDPVETLPAAKTRMKWLYFLHRLLQCTIACLFVWLSLWILSSILSSNTTVQAAHVTINA